MTGQTGAGRNALLIAPRFYEYGEKIKEELAAAGYCVALRHTEPRIASDFSRNLMKRTYNRHMRRLCDRIMRGSANVRIDLVFVVRGHPMPPAFFGELRKRHPESKFVLYEWDSASRVDYPPLIQHFDKVFSFERGDCRSLGLEFLPLFFLPEFKEEPSRPKDIDIALIGGYHPDRDRVFHEIHRQAEKNGLSCAIHLFIPPVLYAYLKLFKKKKILCKIAFRPLGTAACARLLKRSRAAVDVEHGGQKGLTMRTFEALAAGAKVITTNPSVVEEWFYPAGRVLVVDRSDPVLDLNFLGKPASEIDISRHSLKNWLGSILSVSGL